MRAWSFPLACALILPACQTVDTDYIYPPIQGSHLTLPGQAPIRVSPNQNEQAFNQATSGQAQYGQQQYGQQQYAQQQHTQQQYANPSDPNYAWQSGDQVSAQPIAQPQPAAEPAQQFMAQPSYDQNSGPMDYTVKITNTTGSRLFIEAQDANGTIFPCGFTQPRQAFTIPFEQSAPIASPILVVLRDPDQNDAPELRRYRIKTPTASYADKTLQISIISGGRYTADIDGEVYHANDPTD